MEEDILKLEAQLNRIKKRKEQLKTKKSILYLKESEAIVGENFSISLALSVLSNSWKTSSDKQKEEWMKSAESFRKISGIGSKKCLYRGCGLLPSTSILPAKTNPASAAKPSEPRLKFPLSM